MRLPCSFGRYNLLRKLANGGMAEIYLARYTGEEGFSKVVAVKRILPEKCDTQFTAMLVDEARALTHIQHQNVVQVYELGKEGTHPFIAMEYVRGVDLKRLLIGIVRREVILPRRHALFVILQVLQGLACVHREGIVHRDISPANILCSWQGEVKVADFGIAKGIHRTHGTAANQLKGKYSYMSPEQASGKTVDHRTDIYASGIVLFELLSGSRLYDDVDDLKVLQKVRRSHVPISRIRDVPSELKEICCTALSRNPEQRYQTVADFLAALNRYAVERGEVACGFEFGDYLRGLYPDEVEDHSEPICRHTRVMTVGKRRRVFRLKQGLISLLLMSMSITLPAGAAKKKVAAPMQQEIVVEQPIVVERTPRAGRPWKAKREEVSRLSVNAIPWGYVTVPGYVRRREAPLRGLRIKAGMHTIRVEHPPTNASISRKITIAAGQSLRCFARFGPKKALWCR